MVIGDEGRWLSNERDGRTTDGDVDTGPRLATQAPPEKLAYVASFDPTRKRPDAMAVVDLDPESAGYGRIVEQTDLVCSTKGTLPNPIFAAKHGR